MPRYATETDTKILHPTYRRAWLFVRSGTYYTNIHSRYIKTTRIVANKKNLREAMSVLDQRVREFLKSINTPGQPFAPSPVIANTVQRAMSEFVVTKSKSIAERTLMQYNLVVRTYLDMNELLTNTEAIRNRVMTTLSNKNLKINSVNFHMRTLRGFFEFCIEMGYCTKNPISARMVPPKSAPEPKSFSQDEITAIIQQLRTGENYAKYPREREELILLIRLLSTSGMRIAEALKLTKADLLPNGIRIDGKRTSIHIPKIRFFPFVILPEVGEICEVLRTYNPGEKVFSWKNRANPADNLTSAMLSLGINDKGRNLHSLRKTALNRWEKEMGLPEEIRNLLAGHTSAVKKSYYREHTLEDTIATISNLTDFVRNL